eukprot:6175335-Pleurochrysis_carterae.AAC.1
MLWRPTPLRQRCGGCPQLLLGYPLQSYAGRVAHGPRLRSSLCPPGNHLQPHGVDACVPYRTPCCPFFPSAATLQHQGQCWTQASRTITPPIGACCL